MRKILFMLPALFAMLGFTQGSPAWAADMPGYYTASDAPGAGLLAPEELDDLLAPIALYPDPLIAQILPAATFIDQIDEAARYVKTYGKYARVDDQPWDISVRAVAHYPDVLFMMDRKYDWTIALGQAYLDQPEDVMESIQALRAEARDRGNLYSTAQQQVVVQADGEIGIVPAAPQYIYVPVYDPQVIYVESQPSYGFITFGAGFTIGAWLCRDVDWSHHRVYYHGWRRGGWVERSRPHIQDRRGIYINQRATTITTNRRVLQRDTNRFRQELRQDVERRKELPGRPIPKARTNQPRTGTEPARTPRADQQRQPKPDQRQQPRTDQVKPGADRGRQPAAEHRAPVAAPQGAPKPSAPAAGKPAAKPNVGEVFRGRDVQRSQPASRSGYGGYGSSKDATIYRERGQSSRDKMNQGAGAPAAAPKPSPVPARQSIAPAPRPAAPAPRPAVTPTPRVETPRAAPPPQPRSGAPEGGGQRGEQPRR